ncbi:MAG: hypothetical protein AAFX06_16975 [Planctomycetota bacterium]
MTENPYRPPVNPLETSSTTPVERRWLRPVVLLSAVALSIPPIPLFGWVAEDEPFLAHDPADVRRAALSLMVGSLWVLWGMFLIYAVARRWMPWRALLFLLLPLVFGGISFFVAIAYWGDRASSPY